MLRRCTVHLWETGKRSASGRHSAAAGSVAPSHLRIAYTSPACTDLIACTVGALLAAIVFTSSTDHMPPHDYSVAHDTHRACHIA